MSTTTLTGWVRARPDVGVGGTAVARTTTDRVRARPGVAVGGTAVARTTNDRVRAGPSIGVDATAVRVVRAAAATRPPNASRAPLVRGASALDGGS